MTMRRTRLYALSALPLLALGLTACEEEGMGPDDELVEGEATIDASSNTAFGYFTFADGGSAVTVSEPNSSTEWDVAFRRFSAKLNGGVAGPSTVEGANLGNNANATSDEVVAFTLADADAAWDEVTVDDVAGATFAVDGLIDDMTGPWFTFSPVAGTLVANPGAAWKTAEADGGYAVFRVSELVMDGQSAESVTVEYRRSDAGGTLGDAETVVVDVTQGPGFVDLSTGATVSPSGCNWDISIAPSFMIDVNDACDAGTFPLDPTDDFTAITTAEDAPEYGPFLSAISGAIPGTVDDASGVFWYNIEGNNRMWPTFNVFLIRIDSDVYKIQVTDYYDAGGASGYVSFRFEQLQ